jgi:hypothetical protein
VPKKRSKNNPLSTSNKQRNRTISSQRVACENIIAMLKRFKIIADRYRNRCLRFGLRFFLIAAMTFPRFRGHRIKQLGALPVRE